jgi:hypothetical protein
MPEPCRTPRPFGQCTQTQFSVGRAHPILEVRYNCAMQRKVFWLTFTALGIVADLILPFWWALGASIPVGMLAWWIAYRSDWF